MKSVVVASIAFLAVGWAQTPPPAAAPAIPPDTVIAGYGDGKKLTYGELQKFISVLAPQQQQGVLRNRKEFVEQYLLMRKLSEMATKDKLEEKSPLKESLEFNRLNLLAQAEVQTVASSIPIRAEEQQAYYEQHKSQYEQVTVKTIYIPFSSSPSTGADGKKRLSEEEARAKAVALVKEAKAGADFVKLVKENSEDATTKSKDGDLTMSRTDNLPESIRTVTLALKHGEVSEPVRQPNGFYIFRGESVTARSFAEVKDQIFTEMQRIRMKEWLESTTKSLNIKPENEQFFSAPSAQGPAAAPHGN